MAATAEERIPALASSENIFSLAVPFAAIASERRIGANAARGQKTHQGIFSTNRAVCVSASRAKWPGTHQVSGQWWSETVLRIVIDANGDTLSDPSGKAYTWDFENRLVQAVVPGTNGGTTTFKYDPFGRRIYKSSPDWTGAFVYDGRNLIETLNSSGAIVADYTQTRNIDETLAGYRSGASSYYEADSLESITSLSSSTGALANTYTYDSFGNLTNSTGTLSNPFQYTGREFDSETGLYYYRARYYDPTAGRFVSEDPIRFQGGSNFYRYAKNNVVNATDPWGLCPCTEPSAPYQGDIPFGHVPWDEPFGPNTSAAYGNATGGPFNNNLAHVSKQFGNNIWSNCVRGCLLSAWNPCTKQYIPNFYYAHAVCFKACTLGFLTDLTLVGIQMQTGIPLYP
jgi:RHS repeat-associated protein